MPYATKSSLPVRIPKPRNSLASRRRIALKVLTGGLAAVAAVVMAVATAMTGAGWLLAVSIEARSNLRSVVGLAPPPSRLARTGPPAARTFAYPVLNPIGALALVIPDSPDTLDEHFTGSIGSPATKLASLDVASAGRSGTPSIPPDENPLPLPRARPRLAALAPVEDLKLQLEEDARSVRTAIYDITAKVVYLPGGERLEAHSGLGDFMDDPRYVHRKMRGATPPNTYKLTLRESLFHGVRAIRLTPVGDGNMFNRDGILAHSYMLGPNGQSNGCVSFKDYPKFLRAYLRGEIDRIVVVSRLDRPPTFATRPNVRSAAKAL